MSSGLKPPLDSFAAALAERDPAAGVFAVRYLTQKDVTEVTDFSPSEARAFADLIKVFCFDNLEDSAVDALMHEHREAYECVRDIAESEAAPTPYFQHDILLHPKATVQQRGPPTMAAMPAPEIPLVIWQHIAAFRPSVARRLAISVRGLELKNIVAVYLACVLQDAWRRGFYSTGVGIWRRRPRWAKIRAGRHSVDVLPSSTMLSMHFTGVLPTGPFASHATDAFVLVSTPLPRHRAAWVVELTLQSNVASYDEPFSVAVYPADHILTLMEAYLAAMDTEMHEEAPHQFSAALRDSEDGDPPAAAVLDACPSEDLREYDAPPRNEAIRKLIVVAQFMNDGPDADCDDRWGGTHNGDFNVPNDSPEAECLICYGAEGRAGQYQAGTTIPRADAYRLVLRGTRSSMSAKFVRDCDM